ncbi:DUF2913 family protein [Motilimonas eburnea]|uniref:DUF2913 family protein n=1 Tax=Motilimonas eburnea TaxID=1737488 RepID=UPI001E37987D|nr:DUF2913 family protein [Motilimonas eburnea]MCE2570181.1 DUF2913 family protein [Motilimonas eburnea]
MNDDFAKAITLVAETALLELEQACQQGGVSRTPVNEAHYINAWVTKAIKLQRFPHCVAKTLLNWQQQGRSLGKKADILPILKRILATYAHVRDSQHQLVKVYEPQLQTLLEQLTEANWNVIDQVELARKMKLNSNGQDSLIICAKQYADAINETERRLIRPLSLYVRGDVTQLVDLAYQQQLLLFKKTDYKSKVKFHGEYLIFPSNKGDFLPEFPNEMLTSPAA